MAEETKPVAKPGETTDNGKQEAKPGEKKDEKAAEEKPKEKAAQAVIGGVEVKYLAQTGVMPLLKEDGTARANVFYIY